MINIISNEPVVYFGHVLHNAGAIDGLLPILVLLLLHSVIISIMKRLAQNDNHVVNNMRYNRFKFVQMTARACHRWGKEAARGPIIMINRSRKLSEY